MSKSLKITPVTDGIYTIDTYYLDRPDFAACYLIEDSGRLAFVETNTNYAVPHLSEAVKHLGYSPEQVQYVILTHIHLDHAGGAGLLMRELPEAQLVVHARGRRHMIDPSKLIEGVKAVYGEEKYHRLYGEILPIDKERIRHITGDETVEFGGRTLECYDSPGHAKHHMVIHDPVTRSVFSGDAFGIAYPRFVSGEKQLVFPSTSPVQFEPERALETYEKIVNLEPERVLPTHFGPLTGISDAHGQLKQWIDFAVEIADKYWEQGLRDKDLHQHLYNDIVSRFTAEIGRVRGSQLDELTDDEKEFLFLDCDLNAQGIAYYIKKKKEAE